MRNGIQVVKWQRTRAFKHKLAWAGAQATPGFALSEGNGRSEGRGIRGEEPLDPNP